MSVRIPPPVFRDLHTSPTTPDNEFNLRLPGWVGFLFLFVVFIVCAILLIIYIRNTMTNDIEKEKNNKKEPYCTNYAKLNMETPESNCFACKNFSNSFGPNFDYNKAHGEKKYGVSVGCQGIF